ncbi:MAG TPA: PTS system mannose/fructose/sorbose family transporter subunit IID [Longimicrobiales bacterium]|nr:PTS system mannose/fructose/sorbose family transporter subunit IID [Longimicrobiales bacterium]
MQFPRSVLLHVFLRSFAIQGSWNYRTLQGSGFAFALLPALRYVHRDSRERLEEAVQRHTHLFNAHPYLSGVALGAVARLEADGVDPALIERFKNALRSSLGALGDRVVWAGWRPACLLLALVVLLVTESAAAAVLLFLVIYNSGHLALRWWGLRVGIEHGRHVGEQLRQAPLLRWHRQVVGAAMLLLGIALPLVVTGALTERRMSDAWVLVPLAGAAAGWPLGPAARLVALVIVAALTVAGFLIRLG